MIVNQLKGNNVVVRYRDSDNNRKVMKIKDTYAYCFVEDSDAQYISYPKESGYKGLYGELLTKITVPYPQAIHSLRNTGKTWEANIPYVNRVLSERLKDNEPIQDYKHRVWYLDGEWKVESGEITMLTVEDSYTGNLYSWFMHPDYPAGKYESMPCNNHPDGVTNLTFDTPVLAFDTEKDLLNHFIKFMNRQDPDILCGYYLQGADIKQIFARCRVNNIQTTRMSPLNRVEYEFGDGWSQPIKGRICMDLMTMFTKLYELKNGKLSGYKLDDVAYTALGERKVELPDGHDTYYSDLPTYLDYNRQDVRLLRRLDEKQNCINHYLAIQHIVQCDIKTTPFVTKIFACLALNDPEFELRIPTSPQFTKEDYQGADIMKVEPQVYDNVGIFDVKAMYHSNIDKYGISWETLDPENGTDCGNGVKFDKSKKGLLVRQMDKMTELRNLYKKMMAVDGENYHKWDAMQYATKSLVASMYGVAGDAKCGFYHPSIASAITYTSRNTLGELAKNIEDNGYEVIYGHTDSCFAVVDTPEKGVELTQKINENMYPIVTEFEKWNSKLILMAKNRYAGNVAWTDGKHHEPQLYVKGIEMKQSRMPSIMKDAMQKVIWGILNNEAENDVTENVCVLARDIDNLDGNLFCMKGRLDKDLSDYKVLSESRAGANWANMNLGKGYRKGDWFLCTIDNKGNYIAFDDISDINGIAEIGRRKMFDKFVVNKIKPYYEVSNWQMQPILNALDGIDKVEWI